MKLTTNLSVENLLKSEKWTSQFDTPQLNMIRSGLQQGYDVSIYATPDDIMSYLKFLINTSHGAQHK